MVVLLFCDSLQVRRVIIVLSIISYLGNSTPQFYIISELPIINTYYLPILTLSSHFHTSYYTYTHVYIILRSWLRWFYILVHLIY